MKYRVNMTRTTIEYLTVEVEADSKEEAENKAHQETESDEFEGGDPKFFNWEVDNVEEPPEGSKTQASLDALEAAGIPVVNVKLDPSDLKAGDFMGLPVVTREEATFPATGDRMVLPKGVSPEDFYARMREIDESP